MLDMKKEFLEYLSNNRDVFIQAQGGPYIEIDLIPEDDRGSNKMYSITEAIESCESRGIDIKMFFHNGYKSNIGDGIRMGRYWYFMQKTTQDILQDLRDMKIDNIFDDNKDN